MHMPENTRGVVPIIINLGGDDDRRRALGIVVTHPKESGSNQSIDRDKCGQTAT